MRRLDINILNKCGPVRTGPFSFCELVKALGEARFGQCRLLCHEHLEKLG